MTRKIALWAVVAFAVFYLATQPVAAGALIHHAYAGLHQFATSLAQFLNSL